MNLAHVRSRFLLALTVTFTAYSTFAKQTLLKTNHDYDFFPAKVSTLANPPTGSGTQIQDFRNQSRSKSPAPARARSPILVFIHGGAWVGGSAAQYQPLGEALSRRGYCVAVLEYRLSLQAPHPAPVADLSAAIEALSNSSLPARSLGPDRNLNCDVNSIFLVGHSAGAHMIGFWATNHRSAAVKGFIGIEGIYDLPALVKKWPKYRDQFVSQEFGNENLWAQASPSQLSLQSKAPWLLLHSESDELVDIEQSISFMTHLKKEKCAVTLKRLSSGLHFEVIKSLEDPNSDASRAIDTFIAAQTRIL